MEPKKYKYDGKWMYLKQMSEMTGLSVETLRVYAYKFGPKNDIKKVMEFIAEPQYYYGVYDLDNAEMCVCFGTLQEVSDWLGMRGASIHEIKSRGGNNHGRMIGRERYEVHMFSKRDLLDKRELR